MKPLDTDVDPCVVGPFELLARLGEGGMGVAYLARELPLDGLPDDLAAAYRLADPGESADTAEARLVVVKMIQPDLLDDVQARERFDREIDAVRAVVSDRVPALVAAAPPQSARPWYSMDFIAGPDLHTMVTQAGPLAVGPAAALGLALVDALRAIHGAKLLHRDLKPANVVLGPDGPVVLDFGLAVLVERRASQAITKPGEAWGSWPYAPYEQMTDFRNVKEPADVYGLGAVLFFALTGRPPYSTQPLITPPDWSGVDSHFLPLLGQILKAGAGQRPTLDAVDMELQALLIQADLTPEIAAEQLRNLVEAVGLSPELPPGVLADHADPVVRDLAQKAVDAGAAPDAPWAVGTGGDLPDFDPGFYGLVDTDEIEWAAEADDHAVAPAGYTPTLVDPAPTDPAQPPGDPISPQEGQPGKEALPTSYLLAPPRPAENPAATTPQPTPQAALKVAEELRRVYAHRGAL
ncbi:serine/threonine-protein kinase [Streptomyces sp. NPDC047718]|uniref:serine/threonine-protein kinase n=1 Tax=Streptomyces sp. NPDC047718 TaxID=3155479 RepID=UPI0033D8C6D2